MIIDLFNTDDVNYAHVGGKGYNLHKLHKAGLPVPRAIADNLTIFSTGPNKQISLVFRRM